ncbi:formate/nitrite transporter family protein, partial [Pseudonocardia nigra]|uniref:formate/nitrite transporter family protein n=1 Tax=Pseudonocardia nigra TaxID=1921578 RepID=UPI001C5F21FA
TPPGRGVFRLHGPGVGHTEHRGHRFRLRALWKEPEDDQAVAATCPADAPENLHNPGPTQHSQVKDQAQNVWSKFVPLALAVLLFEAANFQHSPANMAFFSLAMPGGAGPGWAAALAWNIAPAAIGNILGGVLLVAAPFWYTVRKPQSGTQR